MLRRITILIVTLFLSTTAAADAIAPDAEELKRLLAYFLEGASRNDRAAHERFWAEELVYTRSVGVRTNKAEILADIARGADPSEPPTTYSAEDIRIQQYGDTGALVVLSLLGRNVGAHIA